MDLIYRAAQDEWRQGRWPDIHQARSRWPDAGNVGIGCDSMQRVCAAANTSWRLGTVGGVIPVRNLKGEEKIMKPIDGAKDDRGKLPLTLVPTSLLRAVAKVRAYGVGKYGEKENWRTVAPERYQNALYRHFLAYLDNPDGIDAESGLPHIYHLACNAAFLVEFYDLGIKGEKLSILVD